MNERNDMNRRDFVARAAVAAGLVFCGGAFVRCAAADDAALPSYSIGALTDYPKDGLFDTYKKQYKVIVARENGKLYVMTDICTHRGGHLNIAPTGDHFICPLHHAQFDDAGNVIKGPAKKPLIRYGVSADDKGNLTVDPTQMFDSDHWTDPGSFVDVSATTQP
jgi:cytochrome b6-f complex iron-sulfur subunit